MSKCRDGEVTIGDVTFDRVEFNEWVDDLSLWRGPPVVGAERTEPVRDHLVRLGDDGEVLQYYVYAVRLQLERDGVLTFWLPNRPPVVLTAAQLEPLLVDPNAAREARRRRRSELVWRLQLGGRVRPPRRYRERRQRRRRASDARLLASARRDRS